VHINRNQDVLIRPANIDDSLLIHGYVKELAEYERSGDQVTATVESIAASMFGPDTPVRPLIALVDGEPAGFAVYFFNYSTWQGKKGLYLEDLYVWNRPAIDFYLSIGAKPKNEWIRYRMDGQALIDFAAQHG